MLSYFAERVIGRHPVPKAACLSFTLTDGLRGLSQTTQKTVGTRQTLYIPYLSVINKIRISLYGTGAW